MHINRFWLLMSLLASISAGLAGIEINISLGKGDHSELARQILVFASFFGPAIAFFIFAFIPKKKDRKNKNTMDSKDAPTGSKHWRN